MHIPTRASHERSGLGSRGRVALFFHKARRDFRPLDAGFSSATWSVMCENQGMVLSIGAQVHFVFAADSTDNVTSESEG